MDSHRLFSYPTNIGTLESRFKGITRAAGYPKAGENAL